MHSLDGVYSINKAVTEFFLSTRYHIQCKYCIGKHDPLSLESSKFRKYPFISVFHHSFTHRIIPQIFAKSQLHFGAEVRMKFPQSLP